MRRVPLRSILTCALLCLAACKAADSVGTKADFTTPATVIKAGLGDNQSAAAGAPFPQPLQVIVFTPTNNKCNGCGVVWTLSPGQFSGGSVSTHTDVTGTAAISITGLSPKGSYHVQATIANGQSVTFTLDAT